MLFFRISKTCLRPIIIRSNYSTKTTEAVQKENYYKNLATLQDDDSKPAGWDEATPYESIPGPKPIPILGNTWRFFPGGEFHNLQFDKMMKTLTAKYGKVIKFGGIMGRKDMIYIFDPDDMEYMLRNAGTFPIRETVQVMNYYRTVLRKDIYNGLGGLGTVQGEEWYNTRTKVNPVLMQPKVIQNYTPKMDEIAKALLKYTKNKIQNGGIVNYGDDLNRWALESVAFVSFNKRLGAIDIDRAEENSEVTQFIQAALKQFDYLYYLEILPPYWKYFPSKKFKEFVKNMDVMTSFASKYIDEGLKEDIDENVPDNEMSVLRQLVKKDKNVAFVTTIEMLSAGVDTTSKTLGAALYFLAKNPDIQKKLRDEVLKYLPHKDSPVDKDNLAKMAYVKAVVKETTRIAPIAIGNLRTATKDMILGGYQIPKGTQVLPMHFFSSNLTDKYFKDPDKFIPERWLRSNSDESLKNVHSFAMMPFGFGPRSCIGKRLATLEMEVGLANIIRNFELSWDHPDLQFGAKLLYGFVDPLKLTFKELDA